MAETYFRLVIAGKRTCNIENGAVKHVPATFIAEVREMLKERGYDEDGKRIG